MKRTHYLKGTRLDWTRVVTLQRLSIAIQIFMTENAFVKCRTWNERRVVFGSMKLVAPICYIMMEYAMAAKQNRVWTCYCVSQRKSHKKDHVKLYIQYTTYSKQLSYYLLNSHRFVLVYSPTSLKFQLHNLKMNKDIVYD
jgi:hypothetical protein